MLCVFMGNVSMLFPITIITIFSLDFAADIDKQNNNLCFNSKKSGVLV